MPRGPKGEKRPADVIGNAVHVMRIATLFLQLTGGTSRLTPSFCAGKLTNSGV